MSKSAFKETAQDQEVRENVYRIVTEELRGFIERIEQIGTEMDEVRDRQKEVYASAKARGYDVKAIRTIIRERKKHVSDLQEEFAVLELYREALNQ